MLWGGAFGGDLELRAGRGKARRLKGRFPYGKRAVLSDGGKRGRPKKEVIAPRAFAYRVEKPEEDIHLLVGHDYDRPLASRVSGTMDVRDSDEALTFDAELTPEIMEAPYAQDFLAAFTAGLIRGLSPGFRIPPPRTVPNAEDVAEEDPAEGDALIRTIFAALLYELSLVTVAAYKETEVEERQWSVTGAGAIVPDAADSGLRRTLNRWRP
jgi:hypothetical protein